jgi:hypothetical protein
MSVGRTIRFDGDRLRLRIPPNWSSRVFAEPPWKSVRFILSRLSKSRYRANDSNSRIGLWGTSAKIPIAYRSHHTFTLEEKGECFDYGRLTDVVRPEQDGVIWKRNSSVCDTSEVLDLDLANLHQCKFGGDKIRGSINEITSKWARSLETKAAR